MVSKNIASSRMFKLGTSFDALCRIHQLGKGVKFSQELLEILCDTHRSMVYIFFSMVVSVSG